MTEPFRQRPPGGVGVTTGSSVGTTLPPPSNNGGGNPIDGMGRSLDALSLNNTAPSNTTNTGVDTSYPHLKEKNWFYGAITRAECDNLLNQYGQDGDFLVRSSETNVRLLIEHFCCGFDVIFSSIQVGDYSVSLKAPGRNKHFRVHVEGALYVIGQRR